MVVMEARAKTAQHTKATCEAKDSLVVVSFLREVMYRLHARSLQPRCGWCVLWGVGGWRPSREVALILLHAEKEVMSGHRSRHVRFL